MDGWAQDNSKFLILGTWESRSVANRKTEKKFKLGKLINLVLHKLLI